MGRRKQQEKREAEMRAEAERAAKQPPIPDVIILGPPTPTSSELPLEDQKNTAPSSDKARNGPPLLDPGTNGNISESPLEKPPEPDAKKQSEPSQNPVDSSPEFTEPAPVTSEAAALRIELSDPVRTKIPDDQHPIFSRMTALRFVRINHSAVFFGYAILGVALLLWVKHLHAQFDILLYFGVVAGIMGSYFLVNMIDFAGLRLRYDQLGDNLYYLGFIYTLGTLTHTLYVFDGTAANIAEVISSFGIALSSTVLGVVLRIVSHLMRIDPHEVEDAVRVELVDLTSRVRASLDNVVRDMTVFGDQTRQVVQELRDDASSNMKASVERLVSASNRVLEFVDESFRIFTANTSRIGHLSEQTVAVLTALVGKIQAIEAPNDLIERKLLPATAEIERVVSVMTETTKQGAAHAERIRSVIESMNTAIASVRQNADLISSAVNQREIAERVTLAGTALKDTVSFVVALREQMKALVDSEAEALGKLRAQFENAVGNIQAHNVAAKTELDRFRSLTSETQDSLVELARALRKAV